MRIRTKLKTPIHDKKNKLSMQNFPTCFFTLKK